jgi:hypothetical protein
MLRSLDNNIRNDKVGIDKNIKRLNVATLSFFVIRLKSMYKINPKRRIHAGNRKMYTF